MAHCLCLGCDFGVPVVFLLKVGPAQVQAKVGPRPLDPEP